MKGKQKTVRISRNTINRTIVGVLTFAATLGNVGLANAATLTSASLTPSDPRPNAAATSVKYTFTTSNVTSTAIKCIKEVYSTTATGTTAPGGFNSSSSAAVNASSTLINSSTSGWTLDKTTNGTLLYTNATGLTPSTLTGATFVVDNITNPTTAGGYFLKVSTFNNTDCASNAVDSVTIGFTITDGQSVTISVDPTLAFTVTGQSSSTSVNGATTNQTNASTSSAIFLNSPSPTAVTNAVAAQQIGVQTNAGNGFTVYIRYTGQPTSGTNTIADQSGSNASPATMSAGTEAFGYTTTGALSGGSTRFTGSGGNKWAPFTSTGTGDEVMSSAAPVANQTGLIGFQVGISGTTKAGNYTTSVIYTATPSF